MSLFFMVLLGPAWVSSARLSMAWLCVHYHLRNMDAGEHMGGLSIAKWGNLSVMSDSSRQAS